MSAEERRRPRVRLIEQPVKRQRINFATLIKNAALAESEKAGDGDTGVDQLFDKAVGGGPSVSTLRQSTQIYFLVLAGLAIGGVFLAIAVNEILWYSAVGFETVDTVFTTILKISVLVSTGVAFFFLYKYYDGQLQELRSSGVGLSEGFGFMSLRESGLGWYFVMDLVTLIPMPYPFIHFTLEVSDIFHEDTPTIYTSDNLLMAAMFVRLHFVPRLIAEIWLIFNSNAFVAARRHNVMVDTFFVIRALFIANFGTLVLLMLSCVLSSTYLILICERPYPHVDQLAEFDNALYYTIITMTTVGYGDIVPSTRFGRYMALVIALQGVIFLALIIQGVVARVELNPTETRIVDFVEHSRNSGETRHKAAAVMQTVWRQYRLNIRAIKSGRTNVMVKHHPTVTRALNMMATAKRNQQMSANLDTHTESTHKGIDALQDRFDDLEDDIQKILKHLKIQ